MQYRWIPGLLNVVLASSLTTSLAAQLPPQCPQPTQNNNTVIVDLATGNISGERQFPARKAVEVVFLNANPFFFDYKIDQKTVISPEPGLAAFLAFLPQAPNAGQSTAPAPPAGDAAPAPTPPTPASPDDLEPRFVIEGRCDDRDIELAQDAAGIVGGNAALLDRRSVARQAIINLAAEIQTNANNLNTALAELRAATTCQDMSTKANLVGSAIQMATLQNTTTTVATAQQNLETAIKGYEHRIDTFKELLLPQCRIAIVSREVDKLVTHLDTYRAFGKQLETDLVAAKKSMGLLETEQKRVAGILGKPELFHYRVEVPGSDGSATATVEVFRKELGAKDFPTNPQIELELGFGGRQRFTLAAGAAFSSLESLEYDSVQSFALDPNGELILDMDGKPMLTSTVGRVDGSDHRIVPMFALHTRLGKSDPFPGVSGVHLTFGLTAKIDTTTDVEYLLGVSFSLAEERAFLTLGVYNGVIERLRPGFFEGQALPEDLGDIPVETERDWDFVFAFSWRLN